MERDVGLPQPTIKFMEEGRSITDQSCWARPGKVSNKTTS